MFRCCPQAILLVVFFIGITTKPALAQDTIRLQTGKVVVCIVKRETQESFIVEINDNERKVIPKNTVKTIEWETFNISSLSKSIQSGLKPFLNQKSTKNTLSVGAKKLVAEGKVAVGPISRFIVWGVRMSRTSNRKKVPFKNLTTLLEVLSKIGGQKAADSLVLWVRSSNSPFAESAARSLARLTKPDPHPLVEKLLKLEIRKNVRMALVDDDHGHDLPPLPEKLILKGLASSNLEWVEEGVKGLQSYTVQTLPDPIIRELSSLSRSFTSDRLLLFIDAVEQVPHPRLLKDVLRLAKTQKIGIKNSAIKAIARFNNPGPDAGEPLLEILREENRKTVKKAVIFSLTRIKYVEGLHDLIDQMEEALEENDKAYAKYVLRFMQRLSGFRYGMSIHLWRKAANNLEE